MTYSEKIMWQIATVKVMGYRVYRYETYDALVSPDNRVVTYGDPNTLHIWGLTVATVAEDMKRFGIAPPDCND